MVRRAPSPYVRDALQILGGMVAEGRRARRWTMDELAERVGVSVPTVRAIERGEPSVAIGTVFEAAFILRIELFEADERLMRGIARDRADRLRLLPQRVRARQEPVDDDF